MSSGRRQTILIFKTMRYFTLIVLLLLSAASHAGVSVSCDALQGLARYKCEAMQPAAQLNQQLTRASEGAVRWLHLEPQAPVVSQTDRKAWQSAVAALWRPDGVWHAGHPYRCPSGEGVFLCRAAERSNRTPKKSRARGVRLNAAPGRR